VENSVSVERECHVRRFGTKGGEGRCYIREKWGWGKTSGYGKFGGGLEHHCTSLVTVLVFFSSFCSLFSVIFP